ncbi:glycosyltransferase [Cloacibacillus evryensis]|uniref:glycosyltransferase n=1 Tax=Cloacibacillus evryensis TaxID=508460 RepID=UPI000240D714|nr:glycosyltransferase [Cloacibacillus evryensis]EHL65002.1 hypothetical protein HMPREF1006_00534 [Synergistes sp. 3_1_syn1]
MKIAFLSDLASIHTVRWVNIFADHGHEVHVISIRKPTEPLHESVHVHLLPFSAPIGYYLNVFSLKKILHEIKPNVLNAHYASGYGTLGRLSCFHPYVLSVWGSDVYDFPYESKVKMNIIQKNLDAADVICSTSKVMKKQTETLLRKPKSIFVTPFGIDTNLFTPKKNFSEKVKVIGTIKTLAPKYGIDTLIKTFSLLLDKIGRDTDISLVIAGDGPQREELKQLAINLHVEDKCRFLGKIPHKKVPDVLHTFDIYVALSESESFGVAILEASACGVPVIVSDAGGLPEVVEDGVTGIVVPRNDSQTAAQALYRLVNNPHTRLKLGKNGVKRVNNSYNWIGSYFIFQNILNNII